MNSNMQSDGPEKSLTYRNVKSMPDIGVCIRWSQ